MDGSDGGREISKRTHLWLRLAALAVIAAAAWLPRGASATKNATAQSHVLHVDVAADLHADVAPR